MPYIQDLKQNAVLAALTYKWESTDAKQKHWYKYWFYVWLICRIYTLLYRLCTYYKAKESVFNTHTYTVDSMVIISLNCITKDGGGDMYMYVMYGDSK